ncbi:WD40-repeat-containing domain protein [Tribonema minus]|uniref:WD40-repeat-containing domain protein n=1 Tax=Tribonema minus TaxID=303371 RepID=A0A835YJ18_9STRA|nr:WD40-repeat-containing domain protein [Tribonema minus]
MILIPHSFRACLQYDAEYVELETDQPYCTIAVVFSPDGTTFASTHGDHTVKVTDFATAKLLRCFAGHPRTPWTVKYHPTNSNLLASGCLGGELRVWDVQQGTCLKVYSFGDSVISLSFHPTSSVLAISSGRRVHTWAYDKQQLPHCEMQNDRNVRCVCFNPKDGGSLLIAVANGMQAGGGAGSTAASKTPTFTLTMWDFDLSAALSGTVPALMRQRVVLSRALLYNDSGVDLSACGRFLCGCAEFWVEERPQQQDQHAEAAAATAAAAAAAWEDKLGVRRVRDLIARGSTVGLKRPLSLQVSTWDQGGAREDAGHEACPTNTPRALTPDSPWGIDCLQADTTPERPGRYVPHLVLLQLRWGRGPDCGHRWCEGSAGCGGEGSVRLLQASTLSFNALGITSIKFSPLARYMLLGRGVRDVASEDIEDDQELMPATCIYRCKDLTMVNMLNTESDDVNCARFHPTPGMGFAYGARQGGVRLMRCAPAPPAPGAVATGLVSGTLLQPRPIPCRGEGRGGEAGGGCGGAGGGAGGGVWGFAPTPMPTVTAAAAPAARVAAAAMPAGGG